MKAPRNWIKVPQNWGRSVTQTTAAVHGEIGLPKQPSWAGYWTWVTACLIIMFLLYLAKHDRLSVWLAFLKWRSPQPLALTLSVGNNPAPQPGQGGPANPAAPAPVQPNPGSPNPSEPANPNNPQQIPTLPKLPGFAPPGSKST
jgi:hypothetical protein